MDPTLILYWKIFLSDKKNSVGRTKESFSQWHCRGGTTQGENATPLGIVPPSCPAAAPNPGPSECWGGCQGRLGRLSQRPKLNLYWFWKLEVVIYDLLETSENIWRITMRLFKALWTVGATLCSRLQPWLRVTWGRINSGFSAILLGWNTFCKQQLSFGSHKRASSSVLRLCYWAAERPCNEWQPGEAHWQMQRNTVFHSALT